MSVRNEVARKSALSWMLTGLAMPGSGVAQCSPTWLPLPAGWEFNSDVSTLYNHRGDLVAGGGFSTVGGVATERIARWDGLHWHPLGAGIGGGFVRVLGSYGTDLIAGGTFQTAGGLALPYIACWDGTGWSGLGTGTNNRVYGLVEFEGDLIAGGWFSTAGGVAANHVARWDGKVWTAVGAGVSFDVRAVASVSGVLYAGGALAETGEPIARVAMWNGVVWQNLPSIPAGSTGIGDFVTCMGVHDGALYVGGENLASPVMMWTGSFWWPVGSSLNWLHATSIRSIGGELVAGGRDWTIGVPPPWVVRWDGNDWEAIGGGVDGNVWTLGEYEGDLIVGGGFQNAGGSPSPYLARWGCSCYPDCDSSSSLTAADFGCFQTQFVAAHPYADCNHDGALTVQDFGCFQTKFVAGCP